jgi:small conductance mechanosensitive channel
MAAIPPLALPATLPSVAAVPGDVKNAVPALTVMLANGGVNILIAVVILLAGWALSRWTARWIRALLIHSTHIDETLKPLVINFARYGIIAVTLVAVLGQFGVQTTSLIAILGATGLAIGLALQGTLSNVASGVMLLFLRPFRVTEKITVNTITGTVQEIGLFHTEMITDDGLFVAIPNSSIFSSIIINTSREPTRRISFTVDIDREADIAAARSAILEAVARDRRILNEPPPQILVEALAGPQVLLAFHAWIANNNFLEVRSDMRLLVRSTLATAGFGPPVPVPAPAVAPWTPPAEDNQHGQAKMAN